jgi:hypothetical protein
MISIITTVKTCKNTPNAASAECADVGKSQSLALTAIAGRGSSVGSKPVGMATTAAVGMFCCFFPGGGHFFFAARSYARR